MCVPRAACPCVSVQCVRTCAPRAGPEKNETCKRNGAGYGGKKHTKNIKNITRGPNDKSSEGTPLSESTNHISH